MTPESGKSTLALENLSTHYPVYLVEPLGMLGESWIIEKATIFNPHDNTVDAPDARLWVKLWHTPLTMQGPGTRECHKARNELFSVRELFQAAREDPEAPKLSCDSRALDVSLEDLDSNIRLAVVLARASLKRTVFLI